MHYSLALIQELTAAVRQLLPQWSFFPSSTEVALLTTSENATFNVHDPTSARRIIVRVHRRGYHTREEIESEHAWIRALRARGVIETPELVPMRQGSVLGQIELTDGVRYVTAFQYMQGREPAAENEELPKWFNTLGALSAKLHQHSREWQRPRGFTRKTWDYDTTLGARPHWGDWRNALGLVALGPDAVAVLERTSGVLGQRLAAYGKVSQRFGLIHADLRLANLLVDEPQLGIIDFDDCGFGWFVYDFAAAVSFFEHSAVVPEVLDAWIAGYRTVAPLSDADAAMIPVMVMLRRMLLTAWIASRPETPTAQAAGGARYTRGTVELAERFLTRGG